MHFASVPNNIPLIAYWKRDNGWLKIESKIHGDHIQNEVIVL
jgi:hypothetical protein